METQFNPLKITKVTQGVSKLQSDISGDLLVSDSCLCKNISTSTLLDVGPGYVIGVIINSHTAGTLKLWDSTTASGTVICNTITFSAVATTGERWIPFWGASFVNGIYATIGGAADLTIMWN
jgi:hypothetical protein